MTASTSTLKFCRAAAARAVAAVMLGCLVTIGAAHAQQPSPNAVELAKQIVMIKGGANMLDPVVPGVIETAKNMFLPTNPNLSKDLTEVANQLRTYYAPKRDELLTEAAKGYASRFTEQELKDILAFYKSPLGEKLTKEEGPALQDVLKRAQSWANNFSEEVIAKMREEMRKRGASL
jgi:uncharacterized protein